MVRTDDGIKLLRKLKTELVPLVGRFSATGRHAVSRWIAEQEEQEQSSPAIDFEGFTTMSETLIEIADAIEGGRVELRKITEILGARSRMPSSADNQTRAEELKSDPGQSWPRLPAGVALSKIHRILDGRIWEWPDLSRIADIVQLTGLKLRRPDEGEDEHQPKNPPANQRDPITPIHQEDMDDVVCATPGCKVDHGPMYLHARCHPNSKAHGVSYFRGKLRVECSRCGVAIAIVQVARRDS